MKTLIALLLGAALAAVVACGGAPSKARAPVSATSADAMPAGPAGGSARDEIEKLYGEITSAMGTLSLPMPAEVMGAPPPSPMSVSVRPTADPTCQPAATQTCKDSCTLADSICDNAKKICDIAGSMNNDAWANGKCTSSSQSCTDARGRCCGCQL